MLLSVNLSRADINVYDPIPYQLFDDMFIRGLHIKSCEDCSLFYKNNTL